MNRQALQFGNKYTRKELADLLGEPRLNTHREGPYFTEHYVLFFVTLDKKGKVHKYSDFFEEDTFHWDSQTNQHYGTPRITQIRQRALTPLLFVRKDEMIGSRRQPFVYAGELEFIDSDKSTKGPIHCVFSSLDYDETVSSLIDIYEWKPAFASVAKSVEETDKIDSVAARKNSSKNQGYLSDPKLKKAIELRGMEVAKEYYQNKGYQVEDTSSNRPYDLVAVKGDIFIRIEVKATTGLGEVVNVTKNEVISSREEGCVTDLFIVYQIEVKRLGDGVFEASSGKIRLLENWIPEEERLIPTQYRYEVK